MIRESSAWEPLDECPPEAHVTLRSDRPVEAGLADLRALLDSRIGLLSTQPTEPQDIAKNSKKPADALQ